MNWMHYALTVLAAGLVATLTDWFFMGFLFHDKYLAYPEVWRPKDAELRRILWSSVLGFMSAAVFVLLAARLGLSGGRHLLKLALAIWFVAPLPLLITNAFWIKLHPLVVVSQALGWLARLVVAALAVRCLL